MTAILAAHGESAAFEVGPVVEIAAAAAAGKEHGVRAVAVLVSAVAADGEEGDDVHSAAQPLGVVLESPASRGEALHCSGGDVVAVVAAADWQLLR